MKKCPGCKREIDKYGIACQYCNKVEETQEKKTLEKNSKDKRTS
jgi:hypothetical protein